MPSVADPISVADVMLMEPVKTPTHAMFGAPEKSVAMDENKTFAEEADPNQTLALVAEEEPPALRVVVPPEIVTASPDARPVTITLELAVLLTLLVEMTTIDCGVVAAPKRMFAYDPLVEYV